MISVYDWVAVFNQIDNLKLVYLWNNDVLNLKDEAKEWDSILSSEDTDLYITESDKSLGDRHWL